MTNRKSISAGIRMLAIATVAFPASALFAADADAAQFFTQQQIVKKLHVQQGQGEFSQGGSNGQRVHKRVMQPQLQGQVVIQEQFNPNLNVVKRRTPQFENGGQFGGNQGSGHVVMKRVPMPENQLGNNGPILVDQGGASGNVKTFRAPLPENNGGTIVQEMRAPGSQNGGATAQFRAPGSKNNNDVIVAGNGSNGNGVEVRGLEVRQKTKRVEQVAVGQQVASNEGFEAGGTNYPGLGRIDLEILFDYDSDRINPASVKQLIALGEALNDAALAKGRFVIAGHTDATGGRGYNFDLSQRRARAVTEFLVYYAGIDESRLVTEGYGEDLLKYPDAPESGQNRRVEIINLGEAG